MIEKIKEALKSEEAKFLCDCKFANAPEWLRYLIGEVERLKGIEEHAIMRIKTETKANAEYARQVDEVECRIHCPSSHKERRNP